MRRIIILVAGGVALTGLVAWGIWRASSPDTPLPLSEEETTLSPAPLPAVTETPSSRGYAPETNPFTEVETNPLRGVYTNPFSY